MMNLVVALSTEARALIDYYRMIRCDDIRGFKVYAAGALRLVVTGVGKVNAAAGTAYLAGLSSHPGQAWLNIGIAGHRSLAAGTGVHADKINDRASGRNWYPPQVAAMPGLSVGVQTHDQPVIVYPPEFVCDMEASAFFCSAARFSTGELVQCYKVVSDNESNSIHQLTPAAVVALIGDQLKAIDDAIESLQDLASNLPGTDASHPNLVRFTENWHFSAAQKVQLRDVVRRLHARGAERMATPDRWQHCSTSRQLIVEIESYLNTMPVSL